MQTSFSQACVSPSWKRSWKVAIPDHWRNYLRVSFSTLFEIFKWRATEKLIYSTFKPRIVTEGSDRELRIDFLCMRHTSLSNDSHCIFSGLAMLHGKHQSWGQWISSETLFGDLKIPRITGSILKYINPLRSWKGMSFH